KVIISEVYKKEKVPPSQRLNEKKLVEDINKRNSSAFFIPKTAEILDFLKENLKENDVVVVMSNGYFDNLTCRLKEIIESL
ncbi:UDP-N-acetylmuramate:L-alanyl-gamma-D-glutamyl-meso-diaminopimelate ligase, partial [Candidatus Aminicenantes bacterium AC-335-A11]|nr:UDP-N-acetylmuramate:L-alanyl-gamma-D-glutamyl-meso-diaminopimelate ligase [Candidatus Aminicenantes bacterium AC-335-A11]